ncbi:ABC transporter ATP-binding protein [Amycolatopsis sp. NBC_01488]|uniref:ABC transporter ATP-binding protein n=1 Tax=Amycolatopsis sp. NBC_01488 TaxID=2903563 RepID=UPI002E298238|nr:ABC transporter ATP-binding protein [Amycolatopsis sp. NBC_01488]
MAKDLAFSYSKRASRAALRNCSFSLQRGSITGLVGANGAGKSTLIKILATILRPDAGQVAVDGLDLHDAASRRVGRKVSLVAQERPLYRHLSVGEMLRVAKALNFHWHPVRANAWLERFNIPLDRKCGQLSGGQQAQVSLALAVATAPAVLLLDEPVASLDPIARSEVTSQLVAESEEHGTTILVSSHVVSELANLVSDLIVLKSGELVLQGNADDICNSHARLMTSTPKVDTTSIHQIYHFERDNTSIVRVADDSVMKQMLNESSARSVSLEEIVLAYLSSKDPGVREGSNPLAGVK